MKDKPTVIPEGLIERMISRFQSEPDTVWTKRTLQAEFGLNQSMFQLVIDRLRGLRVLTARQAHEKARLLYSFNPKVLEDDLPTLETWLARQGVRYYKVPKGFTSHPKIGEVPFEVSEKGAEAVLEYLTGKAA